MWCIISDLDGTLLDSNQRISKDVISRIQSFERAGGKFTFATGRSLDSVLPYINEVGINTPVILYNGAMIYEPMASEFIYARFLESNEINDIVSLFLKIRNQYNVSLLAFDHEGAYFLEESTFIHKQLIKDSITAQYTTIDELLTKQLVKIMLIGNQEEIHELKMIYSIFTPINSEPELLEFIAKGVNKGVAVKVLMQHLEIPTHKLVAVGDNENDIEMIQTAGLGISVKNAIPNFKAVSHYVTQKTNNEQALIEVIEKIQATNLLSINEHGGVRS
ncbi:Cof-type HAD-IIB family hydrolase [Bacillus canaveralius]|uniref:Cof-type HAD-IIB family hydrolase n=1 Tax=Bacillus canaveralius TaxID=1403243 RepID=UPI000F79CB20|nr:Cof-type HAD-IIB family hydrolase [Bacillus canaveralius]RSK56004.1 HAD family phosphatase [Bacillus canaveralius]